jgi:endogenous inhibitor of DNA gyrase (YacG/DUF329 family)
MATVKCPTCGQAFDPGNSPAMPFCSARCRQIDLRRWLNEEISMPVNDPEEWDPSEWDSRDDNDRADDEDE